jgi:hypothetical protein
MAGFVHQNLAPLLPGATSACHATAISTRSSG